MPRRRRARPRAALPPAARALAGDLAALGLVVGLEAVLARAKIGRRRDRRAPPLKPRPRIARSMTAPPVEHSRSDARQREVDTRRACVFGETAERVDAPLKCCSSADSWGVRLGADHDSRHASGSGAVSGSSCSGQFRWSVATAPARLCREPARVRAYAADPVPRVCWRRHLGERPKAPWEFIRAGPAAMRARAKSVARWKACRRAAACPFVEVVTDRLQADRGRTSPARANGRTHARQTLPDWPGSVKMSAR